MQGQNRWGTGSGSAEALTRLRSPQPTHSLDDMTDFSTEDIPYRNTVGQSLLGRIYRPADAVRDVNFGIR